MKLLFAVVSKVKVNVPGNICQVLIMRLEALGVIVKVIGWIARSKFLRVIMREWNGVSGLQSRHVVYCATDQHKVHNEKVLYFM